MKNRQLIYPIMDI